MSSFKSGKRSEHTAFSFFFSNFPHLHLQFLSVDGELNVLSTDWRPGFVFVRFFIYKRDLDT